MIAKTPEPPYYAVIFTNRQTDNPVGYAAMAQRMEELAREQPGFLGIESVRASVGITVSYWRDEAALLAWKANIEHMAAQKMGREKWYADYTVRVARVERQYSKRESLQGSPGSQQGMSE